MPETKIFLTDEAVSTFKQRARELVPRRTMNRYLNFCARAYTPYLAPAKELPFNLAAITYTEMLRMVTQGGSGFNGRVPRQAFTGEEDPRRIHLMNLEERTLLVFAAAADAFGIPKKDVASYKDTTIPRASWALEFLARDWIRLRPKYTTTVEEASS